MKHGPNALIDETLPVVVLATRDERDPASKLRYEKTLSNIQEVTARSGRVIAIATEGDTTIGASSSMSLQYLLPQNYWCRSLRLSRCSCSRITLPSAAAATSTSRATSPSPLQSSNDALKSRRDVYQGDREAAAFHSIRCGFRNDHRGMSIPAMTIQDQFGQIDIYVFDQILRGNIDKSMRVLDAGCGYGRNLVHLLREGCEVFAVDADADAVEHVRRLAASLEADLPAENFKVGCH